jgi:diketogulonate reductase-like aldo/keto reductase
MNKLTETLTLHNGVKIPKIGFGTFRIQDGKEVINAIKNALNVGYRHIDTASAYNNETGIGKAIKESEISRKDIFLVSKVLNADQGYESTLKAFEASINRLQVEYLDAYLIHWPKPLSNDTWKAMETLYKDGKIRAIGVSNFMIHHLETLLDKCEIVPMLNQIELHPQFPQEDLQNFCSKHNIIIEAWAPLMQGKIFNIELMKDLSKKYKKSIAQIALRWLYQLNIVSIPKSSNPERIKNNVAIFDFTLSDEDMERIKTLKGDRIGPHPDKINF